MYQEPQSFKNTSQSTQMTIILYILVEKTLYLLIFLFINKYHSPTLNRESKTKPRNQTLDETK